jgi:hypothetical protein
VAEIELDKLEQIIESNEMQHTFTNITTSLFGASVASPSMMVGGIPFLIRCFPSGNKTTSCIGVFVEYDKESIVPPVTYNWECFVYYRVALVHPNGKLCEARVGSHRFTSHEVNWGYSKVADHHV